MCGGVTRCCVCFLVHSPLSHTPFAPPQSHTQERNVLRLLWESTVYPAIKEFRTIPDERKVSIIYSTAPMTVMMSIDIAVLQ